jgi:signal peptidase I
MSMGSDRLATLRSRAGEAPARCLLALLASVGVLSVAGCGGGSHAVNTTAAADVNGAPAGAGASSTTTTTGASATSASGSATSAAGTTTAAPAGASSGQAQGNAASGGGSAATGRAVRNGPNDPTASHGGSSGKPAAKSKTKTAGKTGAGGAGAAGSGSGSSAGAGGGSGASAPNANTGIPYEVNTTSMEPAFQPETKIYYDPTRTHPQIGEVVVFYLPAGAEEGACGEVMAGGRACTSPLPGQTKNREMSFKRVVGLPGDTIAIRAGHVIRNGQPEQPEPTTLPCEKDEKVNCEFPTPITVPAGHYYLMADNRGLYKEDSRIFGAVPQEYILGTVEGG